jgi:aminomethyltransferase
MACSVNSVFPLRMEAALLWRRFDLMENTPWEVNMGWSVHLEKGDFRGKGALVAAKGKERFPQDIFNAVLAFDEEPR